MKNNLDQLKRVIILSLFAYAISMNGLAASDHLEANDQCSYPAAAPHPTLNDQASELHDPPWIIRICAITAAFTFIAPIVNAYQQNDPSIMLSSLASIFPASIVFGYYNTEQ